MSLHSLDPFCKWLATTALSTELRDVEWLVPALQTVHIIAVSLLVTSALLLGLRLIGMSRAGEAAHGSTRQLSMLIWWPLLALAVTGAALICAEPARALQNPVFYLKMSCLLLAAIATLMSLALLRSAKSTRILSGALSLVLWVAVVFAGRWIAYFQGS